MKTAYIIIICILIVIFEIIRELNTFKIKKYDLSYIYKAHIRVLFISDLHSKKYGKNNCRLLSAIKSEEPDIIITGGDMITASEEKGFEDSLLFLKSIKDIAPCCYGMGNHEIKLIKKSNYDDSCVSNYFQRISDIGITLLNNSGRALNIKNKNIYLYGISIPIEYYKRFKRKKIDASLTEKSVQMLNGSDHDISFLLAHDPSGHEAYSKTGYDIVLSGHYHGGIIRFGSRGLISPQFKFLDKYSYGLKTLDNNNHMIISGGIGEHTIPIRFLNPAEINIIDL